MQVSCEKLFYFVVITTINRKEHNSSSIDSIVLFAAKLHLAHVDVDAHSGGQRTPPRRRRRRFRVDVDVDVGVGVGHDPRHGVVAEAAVARHDDDVAVAQQQRRRPHRLVQAAQQEHGRLAETAPIQ